MTTDDPPPLIVTPAMVIGLSSTLAALQDGVRQVHGRLRELVDRDAVLASYVGPLAVQLEVHLQASLSRTPAISANRSLVSRRGSPTIPGATR